VTLVHDAPQGDVFFPVYDEAQWTVIEQQRFDADERHSSAYTIQTLERAQ